MLSLDVYYQNQKVFNYPLEKARVTIGRSGESDLILQGEAISRRHALLSLNDNSFWIEDLSAHGTWLNGQKLEKKSKFETGDTLKILDWELRLQPSLDGAKDADTQNKNLLDITKNLPTLPTPEIVEFNSDGKSFKSLQPLLLIKDPQGQMKRLLMKKKSLILGTASECDVVLSDEFASSRHARLTLTDRGFLIEDLDSTNGTWVDRAKIMQICIQESQKIQLGQTEILVSFKTEESLPLEPVLKNEFCGLVGESPEMKTLFGKIQKIAATDMTTLILGETGTGKELVAKALHDLSPRRNQPFTVINCGAISEKLIESELFGHEKGAFTGAEKLHKGVFEQSHLGTLFLDEIGELPLELQAKILRVLEYKTLRRVGGETEIKVDVRLIAATHQNLQKRVSQKTFREDLFYRLYVLPLILPPLRERALDIWVLSQYFINQFSGGLKTLSKDALEKLKNHDWPGNVRELKNTLLRALAFSQSDTIKPEEIDFFDFDLVEQAESPSFQAKIQRNEKEVLEEALKAAKGDKEKTAELLGVSRATLFRKLKKFDL